MKVFVVDEKDQFLREAETDGIGSVCIKGPNVFAGYLEDVHNKGVWPKKGWFNTGDLGRQDAQGYFWLTGRKKDLIIRGGHNIDPVMIEDPLYRLPGVQTAAAVSRPDPYAGEVPVAYVQLQQNANLTPEQILDYLKKEVGERAAIPKDVYIIKEMPLTPVGKIFKPALRWDAIRQVYQAELEALGPMAESVEVRVGEDRLHGTLVTLVIQPKPQVSPDKIETRVNEILARYPVKHRVQLK
jgi:fatty-acyl-CoA synthase